MIWLIGNKGMLGTELSQTFTAHGLSFVGTDREVDITNQEALDAFAGEHQIDAIVNCAAYTAVDKAEDDQALCRALNTQGAANIARTAHKKGARLIHISTDYVFNGNGDTPYREGDPTDPTGIYGLTKRDGEIAVLTENPESWIIRTAWLYGKHGNNFVHTMLRLMAEKEELKIVNDQRGSPTWARDLAEVLVAIISRFRSASSIPYGIYHYTNEGNITWYDFAREILAAGTLTGELPDQTKPRLLPCSSAEFPAKVRRPPYSVLDKTKIRRALNCEIPDWKQSLAAFLAERAERVK